MNNNTTQQVQQAILLHETGVSWNVIASFFNTSTATLRKQRKNYEKQQQQLQIPKQPISTG